MLRRLLIVLACILISLSNTPLMSANLTKVFGYWKSVDTKRDITTSVIAIYEHNGQMYGRSVIGYDEKTGHLIDTIYEPTQQVDRLSGKPFLHMVDLVWNLQFDGNRWRGGQILDPRYAHIFTCEAWVENDTLILRGKLGPFGVNTVFYKITDQDIPPGFVLPDLNSFVPNVPKK